MQKKNVFLKIETGPQVSLRQMGPVLFSRINETFFAASKKKVEVGLNTKIQETFVPYLQQEIVLYLSFKV